MTSSFPLKRMKKLVEILVTIFIKERNRCFFLVLLKRGDFLILFIWRILKKHQFSLAGHLSLASLLKRLMWHSAIQNGFVYVSFHKHFSEKQTHLKLQGIRVRKSSGVAFLDLLTDSVAAVAELLHSASGTTDSCRPSPAPKGNATTWKTFVDGISLCVPLLLHPLPPRWCSTLADDQNYLGTLANRGTCVWI